MSTGLFEPGVEAVFIYIIGTIGGWRDYPLVPYLRKRPKVLYFSELVERM